MSKNLHFKSCCLTECLVSFSASKRAKITTKDSSPNESDSDVEEPKRNQTSPPVIAQQTPSIATPSPEPAASPDPDLDVEDDNDVETPENLSLKKENNPEMPQQTPPNFVNYPQFPQFPPFHPHYHIQRSPVDVLLRVFPGRRRSDVEALLQR